MGGLRTQTAMYLAIHHESGKCGTISKDHRNSAPLLLTVPPLT